MLRRRWYQECQHSGHWASASSENTLPASWLLWLTPRDRPWGLLETCRLQAEVETVGPVAKFVLKLGLQRVPGWSDRSLEVERRLVL